MRTCKSDTTVHVTAVLLGASKCSVETCLQYYVNADAKKTQGMECAASCESSGLQTQLPRVLCLLSLIVCTGALVMHFTLTIC